MQDRLCSASASARGTNSLRQILHVLHRAAVHGASRRPDPGAGMGWSGPAADAGGSVARAGRHRPAAGVCRRSGHPRPEFEDWPRDRRLHPEQAPLLATLAPQPPERLRLRVVDLAGGALQAAVLEAMVVMTR